MKTNRPISAPTNVPLLFPDQGDQPRDPTGRRPRAPLHPVGPLLDSFFFAGFESTVALNQHRHWIDQVEATQHDRQADEDYRLLRQEGLLGARDAIRWPLVDQRGHLDFSSALPLLRASRRHGITVIWDLFHYGYPKDLDPFANEFAERFAAYCHAAATLVARETDGPYFFTPVNEPSFLSWAGGTAARFAPHCHDRGPELKISLIRAAIVGINAIWSAVPEARIVNADPVCRIVPPADRPDLEPGADDFNEGAVFESLDMLCGRLHPELGGSRRHLDIVGVNYYWTNQWEIGREESPLHVDDPRRWPLARLLRHVWRRYGGELLVTETSHVGDMRPFWLRNVAEECEKLLDEGIPLRGVCLYPILGMPEWHEPEVWTPMGLWDLVPRGDERVREPFLPLRDALREAQRLERKYAPFRQRPLDRNFNAIAEPSGETIE